MKHRVYWCQPSTGIMAGWQVMVADEECAGGSRYVAQCEEVEAKIIVDALNKAKLKKGRK